MKKILLVVCLYSFANCTKTDPDFAVDRMIADNHRKETVAISDYTSFEWDRMYIFPPYTPESEIEQKLGKQSGSGIDVMDAFCLFAFTNEGRVVGFWEVGRSKYDFCFLVKEDGYSVSEADFGLQRIAKDPEYWVRITDKGSVSREGSSIQIDTDRNTTTEMRQDRETEQ